MMDSMHSMAPNDEELLRYVLDNDPLTREQRAHVEQCTICQERIESYKSTNSFLLSKLYRTQCPSTDELNMFCAQNMLSTEAIFRIDTHIRQCPLCAVEVADIKRMLTAFNPFPQPEVASPLAAIRTLPTQLKRIIASFVDQKPQLVTRSEPSTTGWPRQYRAETINISLHLSRSSTGEMMLLGLFTSDDPDENVDTFNGVTVELYKAHIAEAKQEAFGKQNGQVEQPFMTTNVDDLGNLAFKAIPIGTYTMLVYLPNLEVLIEELTIEHG